MTIRIGDIAPDFVQESSAGEIHFHAWANNHWVVLFSHPADFTPVCTTELGLTARLADEFAKRNVKPIALSVDPVESHQRWIADINDTQGANVKFPIIADADRKVSVLYDMIHPNANTTQTVRSLFIIDPGKKVRLVITYPASTGRNFDEVLRVIDSLQLTDHYSIATPGNWKDGEDVVIVPSLTDPEVLQQKFPKGFKAIRPYLRLTPQPNGHGKYAAPDDEIRHARFPLPSPLDETTSHSTKLQKTAAKSLVIPQAGEGDKDSQREFHVNRP